MAPRAYTSAAGPTRRVAQAGDGFGLDLEAEAVLRRGVGAGQEHLEGDDAVELQVAGLVDDAHAAAPQLAEDLVARHGRQRPPGGGGRGEGLVAEGGQR